MTTSGTQAPPNGPLPLVGETFNSDSSPQSPWARKTILSLGELFIVARRLSIDFLTYRWWRYPWLLESLDLGRIDGQNQETGRKFDLVDRTMR